MDDQLKSIASSEDEVTPSTSSEPQSISSDSSLSSIVKTWNFDGLIIEVIGNPSQRNEEEENADGEIDNESGTLDDDDDNASTIILEDLDLDSMIDENLQELGAGAGAFGIDQEEAVAPTIDSHEENYDGAAGLWAKDFQLQCFQATPVVYPSFQNVQYQKAASKPPMAMPFKQQQPAPCKQFRDDLPMAMPFKQQQPAPCKQLLDDLTKAYDEPLIFTKEVLGCQVCDRNIDIGRGVVLKDCVHAFCRGCIIKEIQTSEKAIMTCPSKLVCCNGEVRDEEIKALLSPAAYDQYNLEMLYKMNVLNTAELVHEYEYVENKNDFKCDICLQDILAGDGVVLKDCLHQYCKPCLSNYIEHSDVVIVPCPFRDDDGLRCVGRLMDTEIRSLVSCESYLAFMKKSLSMAEAECAEAYHCKTPDCPAWVEIEGQIDNYECPACKRINCVRCTAVHEGTSCEDYQEMLHGPGRRAQENAATENQVRQLLTSKTAQNCPRCGILVERNGGCLHMICTKCKHDFNWTGL